MPAPVRKKRARSASASSAAGGEEDAKSPAKKSRTTAKKKTANKRKRARSDVSESDKTIEDDSVASTSCTKATATAAAATGSSRKSLGQTRAVHRFTPIYGAISKDDQSGVSPMCYLLEFDGVNILLDCGASEKFDVSTLELLREIAPKVHLVLVSHSRLEHLGALPYAVAHLGLNAPIYSTLPVKRMGEMYFYDALIAREWGPGAEEVRAACEDTPTTVASDSMTSSKTSDIGDLSPTEQPFTVDHVDAAFERFRTLNYRQNLSVNTPGGTIVITPYPAGGGLGGALWGIKKETDLIVYANHFNHRNELHLQQCALGDPKLSKPILLITDAYNADTSVPSRNARDSRLFDETLSALRSGGNVLIPVDSGSRVLEICLAFDRHWADSRGRGAYNLALYCPLHKSMLGIAQQNMNFMSEELSDQFTKDRINPFTFRYVHQCATREELDEIRGPKVVFASTNTLDYGFAHDLFGEWASNPKNLVLLTDRGSQGSLACRLACAAKNADASKPKGKKGAKKIGGGSLPSSITFVKRHHEDLEGIQLERWAAAREAERERRELERQQAAEKEEAANFRIDDGKDAADEGRASANGDLANSSVSGSADPELSSETIKDKADGSEAESKGDLELKLVPAFAMFHYKDSPSYFDDYGIQGDLTAYMDQFALADATSAISLLVEGEDGDLGEVNSKGSKKKRWKDRMTGVGKDDDLDDEDEEDEYDEYDDDDDDAIPRKLVESSITLDIKCRILYIDMEGRSDDQSMKFMIERMQPRRVAFVHGNHDAASKLMKKLVSKTTSKDSIFMPLQGKPIEMRSDTKTFQIKMDDSLLSSLRMKSISGGDYAVARFDGVIRFPTLEELRKGVEAKEGEGQPNDDQTLQDEAVENRQIMLFAKNLEADKKQEVDTGTGIGSEVTKGGMWMGMGELKLSDLRARLREVGIRAEIKPGGILVCEGNVAISKSGPNNFSMDGVVGDMYYRIRQIIYQALTYVA